MKRILSLFVAVAVVMLSAPSFADTMSKFQGGVKEVVTSPLNVSDDVKTEAGNAKFMPFGVAGGAIKGTFYMAKQMVHGILTIVTSPLDMLKK